MRLFIDLYTDEDVDILVADLLRGRGFDILTTREAQQLGRNDADQLAYATVAQRAFVTHNRADFEALGQAYLALGQTHYGIIIAVRRPPYQIAERLLRILNVVTADELINQTRYI